MSFGWSAGDILAALKALKDVYDLLDDFNGAAGDYREATAFLKSLTQTLEQLATFTHWDAYPSYGDEIRAEVGFIKVPIQLFLRNVKKYEPSLGNPAKSGRLHGIIPKMKWHFICSKEVVALKKTIDSRLQILNSLIQRLILDVTIIMQKNLPDTLRSLFHETIRPGLVATLDEVLRQQMQPAMPDTPKSDVSVIENLQVWDDVRLCLERSTEVAHWSDEVRELDERNQEPLTELMLLSRMVQPTWQLTPTLIAKFHIIFLDAMGGTPRVLQYDAFRNSEVISSGKCCFGGQARRHVPLIAQKRYLIFDENDRALTESNWRDAITPGSKIAMSAIFRTMRSRDTMTKSHECPNKFCRRHKLVQVSRACLKCSGCGKQYFVGSFEFRENRTGRSDSGPLPPKPPTSPGPQAPARQHTDLRSGPSQEPPGGVDEFDESIFATLRIQASEMEEDDETSVFVRVLPEFDDMWSALARINPDSPYDPFEIGHLQQKFRDLSGEHATRLGKANSIRRRVLRHWRERQPESTSLPERSQDSPKDDYNVDTSFSFVDPFPKEDMAIIRRARRSLPRRDSTLSVYSQQGYWDKQHCLQFHENKRHCPFQNAYA
ncbi:hypothetical protein CSOJ01_06719 [Colletotrichum sojae]|uniref:Ubiquitin-like domain-containing protein n=1 Tax=Colletotrichum sojae TaxID=2175907 RepID=A0A8H6JAY9_9PEZI|nr:hypothetical protein CSOJ01_06719 [Colletotrichum sojae]